MTTRPRSAWPCGSPANACGLCMKTLSSRLASRRCSWCLAWLASPTCGGLSLLMSASWCSPCSMRQGCWRRWRGNVGTDSILVRVNRAAGFPLSVKTVAAHSVRHRAGKLLTFEKTNNAGRENAPGRRCLPNAGGLPRFIGRKNSCPEKEANPDEYLYPQTARAHPGIVSPIYHKNTSLNTRYNPVSFLQYRHNHGLSH